MFRATPDLLLQDVPGGPTLGCGEMNGWTELSSTPTAESQARVSWSTTAAPARTSVHQRVDHRKRVAGAGVPGELTTQLVAGEGVGVGPSVTILSRSTPRASRKNTIR